MKKFVLKNLSSIWISVITIMYGMAFIFSNSHIRLLEPPARTILIFACLVLPILKLITAYKNYKKARGWFLITLAVLWWAIATLYFVNPINNAGWILAISQVGHCFILLTRGRFDGSK